MILLTALILTILVAVGVAVWAVGRIRCAAKTLHVDLLEVERVSLFRAEPQAHDASTHRSSLEDRTGE
jgi:hypothetical protein